MDPIRWRFERRGGGPLGDGTGEPDRWRLVTDLTDSAFVVASLSDVHEKLAKAQYDGALWRSLDRHMFEGGGPIEVVPYVSRLDTQGTGWAWIPNVGDCWK